jgi:hypothetical protein
MDVDDIKDKLVNSCTDLNAQYDILDDMQVRQCREEIVGKNYEIETNEFKIFGEKRSDKLKVYYNLLRKVKYQLYNDYKNGDFNKNAHLIRTLQNISNKLQKKLINKYKNKEHSHYDLLLDHYNKIDNNRLNNLTNLELMNTHNEKISIETSKLNISKYTITLVIFIIMLLVCVILIIVYLKI